MPYKSNVSSDQLLERQLGRYSQFSTFEVICNGLNRSRFVLHETFDTIMPQWNSWLLHLEKHFSISCRFPVVCCHLFALSYQSSINQSINPLSIFKSYRNPCLSNCRCDCESYLSSSERCSFREVSIDEQTVQGKVYEALIKTSSKMYFM